MNLISLSFLWNHMLSRRCDFDQKFEELKDIIQVYDVSDRDFRLCNDMKKERILCFKGGLGEEN